MHDFTVLTMYGDAWGSATEPEIGRAIARAIANCKAMSGPELGCGASFTSIRAGWSLGIRCGRENIIVADKDLAEAERRALRREAELRTHYSAGDASVRSRGHDRSRRQVRHTRTGEASGGSALTGSTRMRFSADRRAP